jgi:uncharacterized protein YoxC
METLSFILGMAIVVVIAVAIVAVYAFVKVIKVSDNLAKFDRDLSVRESNLYQTINEENRQIFQRVDLLERDVYQRADEDTRHIHQRIDGFERDVYSQLDSRLDKLATKLTK